MTDSRLPPPARFFELMLVDDSFGDAMLAQEAFATTLRQVHLSIAVSGEEALARLGLKSPKVDGPRPDLILLDLGLPQMDGRAVLRAIKADPGLRTIPVIVMSGSDAAIDVDECYRLGANSYIVKPMYFERLEEIVAAIGAFWFDAAALPLHTSSGQAHAA